MMFENMIMSLQQWGVVDVVLPFVLIFTIVFAVLEKTKILGSDDAKVRKYAVVIAMVVAFSVVVPHITGTPYFGYDVVDAINTALPQIGLLLVSIVMMLLSVGLWTGEKPDGSKGIGVWFILASIVMIIMIFISSIGIYDVPIWLESLLRSDVVPLVIAILVFGVIINFIIGDEKKKDDKTSLQKFTDSVSSFAKGK